MKRLYRLLIPISRSDHGAHITENVSLEADKVKAYRTAGEMREAANLLSIKAAELRQEIEGGRRDRRRTARA